MRDVKRGNPAARVAMQYDKLYVDNKCFIWNDVQGRVTEHGAVSNKYEYDISNKLYYEQGELDGERAGSVLDRSSSVMSFKSMGSPTKRRVSPGFMRSQSCNLDGDNEATQEMIAERDEKIRELEETVRMLKEKLSVCDNVENTEQENNGNDNIAEEELGDTFVTIEHDDE